MTELEIKKIRTNLSPEMMIIVQSERVRMKWCVRGVGGGRQDEARG